MSVPHPALTGRPPRLAGRYELFGVFRGFLHRFCAFLRRLVLAVQAPELADAGFLAHLAAQVVQPALPDVAVAHDVDLVDARRVDHEGALDPDSVRHPTNREVHAQPASGDTDYRALEHLDAL